MACYDTSDDIRPELVGPMCCTRDITTQNAVTAHRDITRRVVAHRHSHHTIWPFSSPSVLVRRPSWLRVCILLLCMDIINSATAKGLVFESSSSGGAGLESSSQMWRHDWVQAPSYKNTPVNVTAVIGDSAYLPCTVHHLGDRSVTWMRQRDLHILTAGIFTYSADDRFRVIHPENTDNWTLHIQYTTERDKGVYECQVNSDPKITRSVTLHVLEHSQLDDPAIFGMQIGTTDTMPSVMVAGETTRYIQRGSVLAITCKVYHPPLEAPAQVLWFHGKENIDYDSPRGGISIQSEKVRRQTVSKLMLSGVTEADTGEYHCAPTGLDPATVMVHVQNDPSHGELTHPESLSCSPQVKYSSSICISTLLLAFMYLKAMSVV